MANKTDLLTVGHTALDYIIKVSEFPKANFSTQITDLKTFDGGAAANVAIVGANLGISTSLLSAVGGDFKNSDYFKKMKNLKVNTDSMIFVPGETEPTAFVITDKHKNQISYFYWGASKEFNNIKAPIKTIENTKAIHLATGAPDFNWKCSLAAKNSDTLVSFDPGQDLGMYNFQQLKDVIKNTTILFSNHYELERICQNLNVDINGLKKLGPKIIVKTCGEKGSIIYSKNEKIEIDAIPINAVDPTGAGDSYRAGFLSRFLNGESLEESAKFASTVSSFIIEEQGCQTKIPTFDDAYQRMINFYK